MKPTETALYSTVEPEMLDLVELFVDELPDRLGAMRIAYDRADWPMLSLLAGQMTTAGFNYGFPQICPVAKQLAEQAEAGSVEEEVLDTLLHLQALGRRIRAGMPPSGD